jgi:hypothetical protein
MTGTQLFAALCSMALYGAFGGASASPLPLGSPAEIALAQDVDYPHCVWRDGSRLCRSDNDHPDDDNVDALDYGSYGSPGIYLGFGGSGYGQDPFLRFQGANGSR